MKPLVLSGRASSITIPSTAASNLILRLRIPSSPPVVAADAALVANDADAECAISAGFRSAVLIGEPAHTHSNRFARAVQLDEGFGHLDDGDLTRIIHDGARG